jgi:hypothetical protein
VTLPVWAWLDGRLAVIFGTLHQALARVALAVLGAGVLAQSQKGS